MKELPGERHIDVVEAFTMTSNLDRAVVDARVRARYDFWSAGRKIGGKVLDAIRNIQRGSSVRRAAGSQLDGTQDTAYNTNENKTAAKADDRDKQKYGQKESGQVYLVYPPRAHGTKMSQARRLRRTGVQSL